MAENLVRGFIIFFHFFLFYNLLNIEPTIFRQNDFSFFKTIPIRTFFISYQSEETYVGLEQCFIDERTTLRKPKLLIP